jgi:hypothetical protein
MFYIPDGDYTF